MNLLLAMVSAGYFHTVCYNRVKLLLGVNTVASSGTQPVAEEFTCLWSAAHRSRPHIRPAFPHLRRAASGPCTTGARFRQPQQYSGAVSGALNSPT